MALVVFVSLDLLFIYIYMYHVLLQCLSINLSECELISTIFVYLYLTYLIVSPSLLVAPLGSPLSSVLFVKLVRLSIPATSTSLT